MIKDCGSFIQNLHAEDLVKLDGAKIDICEETGKVRIILTDTVVGRGFSVYAAVANALERLDNELKIVDANSLPFDGGTFIIKGNKISILTPNGKRRFGVTLKETLTSLI